MEERILSNSGGKEGKNGSNSGRIKGPYPSSIAFFLILLLVFISTCSSMSYSEYVKSPMYKSDALRKLQNVKRRLIHSDDVYMTKRGRGTRSCRGLYDRCAAWNGRSDQKCCQSSSHVCTCNIFFRNCRCEPKAFSWHSWW